MVSPGNGQGQAVDIGSKLDSGGEQSFVCGDESISVFLEFNESERLTHGRQVVHGQGEVNSN